VPAVILGELSFNLLEQPALSFDMIYGIIAAGIVGYLTIGFLLNIAKKINFGKFCIALAAIYFAIAGISIFAPMVA
jgi:undecaprenyl pyrophosphate phosphatase UppP